MKITTPKRGPGRPSFTGEPGTRYQVHLPPSIAGQLRERGGGSLSQGIIRLVSRRKPKNTTLGYLHRKTANQSK